MQPPRNVRDNGQEGFRDIAMILWGSLIFAAGAAVQG